MLNTALYQWACEQLALSDTAQFALLAGDASFRKYYRLLHEGRSWVIMESPPEKEKNAEFIDITQRLNSAEIPAPTILAKDEYRGWLILSDLGDKTLLGLLNAESVGAYYQQGLALIGRLQTLPSDDLPRYDRVLLNHEMDLFLTWFVEAMLGYKPNAAHKSMQQQLQNCICDEVLHQPQVFVHRDYHSRNLMVVAGENAEELAVIDYQDAVQGPISYDLVSLLRDCYIAWPQEKVAAWVEDFYHANPPAQQQSLAEFQRGFDFMGLQRHIKVLGIFARLALRDSKQGYLNDLPLVLQYTLSVAGQYPEFEPWLAWFKDDLMPLVQKQAWAQDLKLDAGKQQ